VNIVNASARLATVKTSALAALKILNQKGTASAVPQKTAPKALPLCRRPE
jgi:hypothetical protein